MEDLSLLHRPVSGLFKWPENAKEWDAYRLSREQLEFFEEYGYLANVRLLDEEQIETLRRELSDIMDPAHPGNGLFYEFQSNESTDPERVVFHALGAWRITKGYHDILWNPAFTRAASSLLGLQMAELGGGAGVSIRKHQHRHSLAQQRAWAGGEGSVKRGGG